MGGSLTGLLSLAIFRRTRAYAVVTMSIPKDIKQFVDSQVAGGQYRSVSDYVRELIRADEQRHKCSSSSS
jgi:Arc/MetJ-type ribon-helix-helix transcriptional regulator